MANKLSSYATGISGENLKILETDGADATKANVRVQLIGRSLQEQLSEANAVAGVLTFSDFIKAVEVYNTDATNAGTFTVNGIPIKVPAGKVFKSSIGGTPSKSVTVTGATTYIVSRYM